MKQTVKVLNLKANQPRPVFVNGMLLSREEYQESYLER